MCSDAGEEGGKENSSCLVKKKKKKKQKNLHCAPPEKGEKMGPGACQRWGKKGKGVANVFQAEREKKRENFI